MDTPIMTCTKNMFDVFDKYCGKNGIATSEEVDKFIHANFDELIKRPLYPEVVKDLLDKVDAIKENGINKQQYAGLLCNLLKAYSEDKIALADKPANKPEDKPEDKPADKPARN